MGWFSIWPGIGKGELGQTADFRGKTEQMKAGVTLKRQKTARICGYQRADKGQQLRSV
jgi:hypothetical protein